MITIYIGDVTANLATMATQADANAQLITADNCDLSPGTYYTSIGDLKHTALFAKVLSQADTIVYAPPAVWSDTQAQLITEKFLTNFADKKQIKGFTIVAKNKDSMLQLEDQRKTDNIQLWVVGCSITAGVGVASNQSYGQLLADTLNIPVSFLTKGSSSIAWASDQILRSDIRTGDIIVWGLTSVQRYPFFVNGTITPILASAYVTDPTLRTFTDINLLDSEHLMYQAVTEIHKVINVCNKLGIKLVLAALTGDELCPYLYDLDNFTMLFYQFGIRNNSKFVDVGTDHCHPGPIMHQYYHDQILKKLKEENK